MSEKLCVPANEEAALVEERLVLRVAALKSLVKCYLDFAEALSSSDDEVVNKAAAALEVELTEFEQNAAYLEGKAAAEMTDIASALESSRLATESVHEAEEELRAVQLKMEQEQAATKNKKDVRRLAAELKKLTPVEEIHGQLAAVQREVERVQAHCAKLESRVRARQALLQPLQAAAEQLQTAVTGKQQQEQPPMVDDKQEQEQPESQNESVDAAAAGQEDDDNGDNNDDDIQI